LAGYFFDSSALVKLYHPETGTSAGDQIVSTSGNLIRVSRLTVGELTSAFAIKVRTQSINREDADVFLRHFRRDVVTGKREVFSIGESEFAIAESLVGRYAFDLRPSCPRRSSTCGCIRITESEIGRSFCRGRCDTL
jgi:hypothetical protein